jgi:hypothetical protein
MVACHGWNGRIAIAQPATTTSINRAHVDCHVASHDMTTTASRLESKYKSILSARSSRYIDLTLPLIPLAFMTFLSFEMLTISKVT